MSNLDWSLAKIKLLQEQYRRMKKKKNLQDLYKQNDLTYELLKKVQLCPAIDKYDPYLLDVNKLQKEVEEKFYDPQVLRTTRCIAQNIVQSTKNRIHLFLHDLNKIGSESEFGVALAASVRDAKDFMVLKVPQKREDNYIAVHELAVGLFGTNSLREFIPNFVYVYGGFDCSAPIFKNNHITDWCSEDVKEKYQYVMYENVTNSVSFRKYVEQGCSANEFLQNYLQILLALDLAQKKIGFTHYDLHYENVLIRKLPENHSLRYFLEGRSVYLNGNTVATIIDYGMSHFVYQGNNYGSLSASDLDDYFTFSTRGSLYFDAYKLMMFCAYIAKYSNNLAVLGVCERILPFFNKTDKLVDILDPRTYFVYPPINENKYSLAQLIKYVDSANVLTTKPLYPLFICQNTCYNSDQLYKKIEDKKINNIEKFMYQVEVLKLTPVLNLEEIKELLNDCYQQMKNSSNQIKNSPNDLKSFENHLYNYYINLNNLKRFIEYLRLDSEQINSEYQLFLKNYDLLFHKIEELRRK